MAMTVSVMADPVERRVLICAPFGKDADLACHVLQNAGLSCFVCRTFPELISELDKGASAILTVEEVLPIGASAQIEAYLAAQPAWSDLPILVMTKHGGDSPWITGAYERLGNLTLLERPVRVPTLISAARSALRGRSRQYEIRQTDQRKDEFLAMLAHELRNPLAPIGAAAELMEMVQLDNARLKQTSQVIIRQVRHMTELVDDLLDVSRVTRGLVNVERIPQDLKVIATNAVEQVRPMIEARRHHLMIDMPLESMHVLGDAKRLIQILTNLLNNAAKYTPEGGKIVLQMQVDRDQVMVSLQDDGVGIEPELQSDIFQLFAQAERTSDRTQGGLGIGLALVKSLVEHHGGKVTCFSEGAGKGSRFTVSLPRLSNQKPSLPLQQAESTFRQPVAPLRVMVVDDNVDSAEMLAMFLETLGHDVLVEHAPLRAIERARADIPDVCLLDIGLPDMNGNELAACLRTQPETANTVLIAITGYGQEQDRQKSLAAGFRHHLVKPVEMTKLTALLASIAMANKAVSQGGFVAGDAL